MKTVQVQQGSPEWLQLRQSYFTASECPAALGLSKFMTRSELLKQKATGYTPEVDSATQSRFDAGHQAEAAARPIVEAIIETDLYPVVGTLDIDGLPLLASFDGISMDESVIWESKLWNEWLANAIANSELPDSYWPQVEHQLLVSSADKCYFTVSDGTAERTRGFWYTSNPELRARIIAGWKQFAIDLANYQHTPAADPAPEGRPPQTLPALHIELSGAVVASNFEAFKTHALQVIRAIPTDLRTDTDFADAEATVKWCADVEARLAAAKEHALSQTTSIDQLYKALDDIGAEVRCTRLNLSKSVTSRKEQLRTDIVAGARGAWVEHLHALESEIHPIKLPAQAPDFAGAIKGKRTIDSLHDAVDTLLAKAKIDMNAQAMAVRANLATLQAHAEHAYLFADTALLVHKAPDDMAAIIESRIARHQAEQAAKEAAQRARIQAEEQARAERAAREQQERERKAEAERQQAQAQAQVQAERVIEQARAAAPAATVPVPAPTAPPAAHEPATLKLGDISQRLGFTLTADFVAHLGFKPAATDRASKLYHEADFPHILAALVRHIQSIQARAAA